VPEATDSPLLGLVVDPPLAVWAPLVPVGVAVEEPITALLALLVALVLVLEVELVPAPVAAPVPALTLPVVGELPVGVPVPVPVGSVDDVAVDELSVPVVEPFGGGSVSSPPAAAAAAEAAPLSIASWLRTRVAERKTRWVAAPAALLAVDACDGGAEAGTAAWLASAGAPAAVADRALEAGTATRPLFAASPRPVPKLRLVAWA
jgi:hypothetical protein